MKIKNSELENIDEILELYEKATVYQKTVNNKSWRGFKKEQVEKEINERRHFIIMEGTEISCTFLIAFDDPIIWKNRSKDPSIYLHRIATNPNFRGKAYVKKIVNWATDFAYANKKTFIRLDTHSENEKINSYYKSCGFKYKGISFIQWTEDLPEHYKEGSFSLFEIALQKDNE